MSGITEQSTAQLASTIPTVFHDFVNHIITAKVMVALPSGADLPTISAPPITVPSGTWTVNWDFVVTTPGPIVKSARIVLSTARPARPLPLKVIVNSSAAVSPQRWALQLQNDVSDANAFNYKIAIVWQLGQNGQIHEITTFHDPTIAVVKDPLDPPPPPPDAPPTTT